MPYFQIVLSGDGISLPLEGGPDFAKGFFTTRLVKARTAANAQELAKELVLAEWRQGGAYAASNQGSIPSLAVERVFPIGILRGIFKRKPLGYTFYVDD